MPRQDAVRERCVAALARTDKRDDRSLGQTGLYLGSKNRGWFFMHANAYLDFGFACFFTGRDSVWRWGMKMGRQSLSRQKHSPECPPSGLARPSRRLHPPANDSANDSANVEGSKWGPNGAKRARRLAGGKRRRQQKTLGKPRVEMVAGIGFEPMTFRL